MPKRALAILAQVGTWVVADQGMQVAAMGAELGAGSENIFFFARAGFTDAARAEAEALGALLVDLEGLDVDLRQALEKA